MYNAALFLAESLQSIKNQTYGNWQLVIVDDGCTDESESIFKIFSKEHAGKCLYLRSSKMQSGAAVCRNIGLNNCSGELVIFFDADDILEPFCLQQRVQALGENDMAVFKQYCLDDTGNSSYKIFNGIASNRKDAIHAFIKMEAPWQTMAPIWRKNTLIKLHGFDEALVYMEDPDLHLRALLDDDVKISFAYNLPADNYYRINNMSPTKLEQFYDNSIKSRILFLQKWLSSQNINNYYKEDLRFGYFTFLKNFVLARFGIYKEEIVQITNDLVIAKVLSRSDKIKLGFVFKIFQSNAYLIKALRLKGIAYKFI